MLCSEVLYCWPAPLYWYDVGLVVHYFFRILAQSFFATHFCTVDVSRYILTGVQLTAVSWMAQAWIRPWVMAMFFTSHKNKYIQCNRHSNCLLAGYIEYKMAGYLPKRRKVLRLGGGAGRTGASTLVGNSAAAQETFKIQIGISKINNFSFRCQIYHEKFIEYEHLRSLYL